MMYLYHRDNYAVFLFSFDNFPNNYNSNTRIYTFQTPNFYFFLMKFAY